MKNELDKFEKSIPRETIDQRRAGKAYFDWRKSKGNAERNSGVNSDELFKDAIFAALDLGKESPPDSLELPTGRGGWKNWAEGRNKTSKRIRHDVCLAFMGVTGVDITANQCLIDVPINLTSMINLGPIHLIKDDADQELKLKVDYLTFKTSPARRVSRAISKSSPNGHDEAEIIGTVRYSLSNASVYINGSDGFKAASSLFPNNAGTQAGTQDGEPSTFDLIVEHGSRELRWNALPSSPRNELMGDISDVVIAKSQSSSCGETVVSVSAGRDEIKPILTLDEGKRIPNGEQVREKLVAQVLRNRSFDDGSIGRAILSHASTRQD